nr:MAG TPA: hypothetical protein [Caudoviricetes sp.]
MLTVITKSQSSLRLVFSRLCSFCFYPREGR